MIIFVSDMHFGQGPPAVDRAAEAELVACLQSHEKQVQGLWLCGDVFDAWIEYSSLVPKGCARFLGLLASWTDHGIPVSYVIGNHDPWHRDYFETELGVHVYRDSYQAKAHGMHLHIAHGDARPNAALHSRIARALLRHPLPVALYRMLLPADSGMRLARAVKRALDQRPSSPAIVSLLRTHARRLLQGDSCDLVVMGHSHKAELSVWPEGVYLNTGAWLNTRHFGLLVDRTVQLCQWTQKGANVLKRVTI